MKKIAIGIFLILTAVCIQAQNLTWEIKVSRERTKEYLRITRPIQSEDGEIFKISITPAMDCYCYVVNTDSEQDIAVLFNKPIKGGTEVSIPENENIEIAGRGTDTLYIIMSLERQATLESLIQAFDRNPNSQNKDNLHREVASLQNKAAELGEPASEFIASGGTSRAAGVAEDDTTRFSSKNMYVRPITIRH
jgi:hypothetical protein